MQALVADADTLSWIANWAQIFSVTAPVIFGWFAWTARKWVEGIVTDMTSKLEERTKPIQPNANGGKSLPDAINILDRVDSKVDRVHDRIDELHEKVNKVATGSENLRGRFEQHIDDCK